jgi:hypothetical protein
MSGMQGGGVLKNRRQVERLALGDVAHRTGRDSILIVMPHTMPPAPDPPQTGSGQPVRQATVPRGRIACRTASLQFVRAV